MNDGNRRWWALGAMCFALFMIMLDNTVVNVALPSIQRSLHASLSALEWTVNAYTLMFAVLMVTGGRLGDIFGRRRMFLFGVAVFGVSSLATGERRNLFRVLSTLARMPTFKPLPLMNDNRGVFGLNLGHLWAERRQLAEAMTLLVREVGANRLRPIVARLV